MLGIHAVFVHTSRTKFRFSFYTSGPSTRQWSLISFVTSRPSTRQWSLISLYLYQDPLWGNGHWFPYIYIKTLCEAMVIDFLMFTSRISTRQWSWFFFTLRPSTMQWSSIFLHQGPLRGNGHWFLCIISVTPQFWDVTER